MKRLWLYRLFGGPGDGFEVRKVCPTGHPDSVYDYAHHDQSDRYELRAVASHSGALVAVYSYVPEQGPGAPE